MDWLEAWRKASRRADRAAEAWILISIVVALPPVCAWLLSRFKDTAHSGRLRRVQKWATLFRGVNAAKWQFVALKDARECREVMKVMHAKADYLVNNDYFAGLHFSFDIEDESMFVQDRHPCQF